MGSAGDDAIDRLREALEGMALPDLVSAHLFGSLAEGREHRESDVDVAVLLRHAAYPSAKDRFDVRVRLAAELPGALDQRPVDVVILNDAPPLLGRRILATGRLILCNDAELLHAYTRDVQLRAADLQPFLERTRRVKLSALSR